MNAMSGGTCDDPPTEALETLSLQRDRQRINDAERADQDLGTTYWVSRISARPSSRPYFFSVVLTLPSLMIF